MKCEKFSIHWYYLSLFTFVQTDPIQSLLRHFDGEVAASNRQTLNADSDNALNFLLLLAIASSDRFANLSTDAVIARTGAVSLSTALKIVGIIAALVAITYKKTPSFSLRGFNLFYFFTNVIVPIFQSFMVDVI